MARRPHSTPDSSDPDPDLGGGRLSNRAKQRERKELDALTQRLVALRAHELDALGVDPELREAIEEMRPLSRAARNRQAKVVHALLREGDLDDMARRLDGRGRSGRAPAVSAEPSAAERWLQRLLGEGDAAVNELVELHSEADRQQLRQLVRSAKREPPTAASRRALRSLGALLEELVGG